MNYNCVSVDYKTQLFGKSPWESGANKLHLAFILTIASVIHLLASFFFFFSNFILLVLNSYHPSLLNSYVVLTHSFETVSRTVSAPNKNWIYYFPLYCLTFKVPEADRQTIWQGNTSAITQYNVPWTMIFMCQTKYECISGA